MPTLVRASPHKSVEKIVCVSRLLSMTRTGTLALTVPALLLGSLHNLVRLKVLQKGKPATSAVWFGLLAAAPLQHEHVLG